MLRIVLAAVLFGLTVAASAQEDEPPREAAYRSAGGERIVCDVYREGRELGMQAAGATILAEHCKLGSSRELDFWCDESGRWAGCAFTARGQSITYRRRFDLVQS